MANPLESPVAAIIFSSVQSSLRHTQTLLKSLTANSKIISFVNDIPGTTAILPNEQLTGRDAAKFLIYKGHRSIIHFTENDLESNRPARERWEGFEQEMDCPLDWDMSRLGRMLVRQKPALARPVPEDQ